MSRLLLALALALVEIPAGRRAEIAVGAPGLAPGTYAVRVSGTGATAVQRLVVR